MSEEMLSGKEWSRNVGSENWPVSFLHEYAVGLIWDMLHFNLKHREVQLPTLDGSDSGNVLADVDAVILPDVLTSVAGFVPDISLLKDNRPLRCIEVVVTSPPTDDKQQRFRNLGVELLQVPVRSEDELRALFPPTTADKPWFWPKFGQHEPLFREASRRAGVNWPGNRQYRLLNGQEKADEAINALMGQLSRCSPEVRRAFVNRMAALGSLPSLYPLRPENPKYGTLYGAEVSELDDADKEPRHSRIRRTIGPDGLQHLSVY